MWDLATARSAAGLAPGDTTHDVAVQSVMDYTLASVEHLLGRGLLRARVTERFYDVSTRSLRLHRWPIETVFSPKCRVVQHRIGWVEPEKWSNDCVAIDYIGGFRVLPSDLEGAMWEAFKQRYGNVDPVTGLPASGTGTVATPGGVSRVSVADFGSVTFDTGGASSGSSDTGGFSTDISIWGWLYPWASILRLYQSERAPSVAIA